MTIDETVAAIRAKAEKQIAEEIRLAEMKEFITREMGLDESAWHPGFKHTAYADCFVELNAYDLAEALCMAEKAKHPIPLCKRKGTFTSFLPESKLTDKDWKDEEEGRTIIDRLAPYCYHIDGFEGRVEKVLYYYEQIGPYVVECRVTVQHDPLTYIQKVPAERDSRGRIITPERYSLVNSSGHFTDSIRWNMGDSKNWQQFTAYAY